MFSITITTYRRQTKIFIHVFISLLIWSTHNCFFLDMKHFHNFIQNILDLALLQPNYIKKKEAFRSEIEYEV